MRLAPEYLPRFQIEAASDFGFPLSSVYENLAVGYDGAAVARAHFDFPDFPELVGPLRGRSKVACSAVAFRAHQAGPVILNCVGGGS